MSESNDFLIQKGVLTKYSGHGSDVAIPEGVTSIAERAFYENKSIRTIYIPESVVSIGNEVGDL